MIPPKSPEFLSPGQMFRVVLGHTVVLLCEVENLVSKSQIFYSIGNN